MVSVYLLIVLVVAAAAAAAALILLLFAWLGGHEDTVELLGSRGVTGVIGPQGPTGPIGPTGPGTYVKTQDIPATNDYFAGAVFHFKRIDDMVTVAFEGTASNTCDHCDHAVVLDTAPDEFKPARLVRGSGFSKNPGQVQISALEMTTNGHTEFRGITFFNGDFVTGNLNYFRV